jgi:hypothetical protein
VTSPATEDVVVRRFARRPGYRLVTYREVGLPYWNIPVRCRLLARKDLPVIDEFVLKAVDAGLGQSDDIATFLTLPLGVVEAVMAGLVSGRHLIPTRTSTGGDALAYVLSERGGETLRSAGEVRPQEDVISFSFDGLTGQFTHVEPSARWRPRDLREHNILEIPAFPADPPSVGPSHTQGVADALREGVDRLSARKSAPIRRDLLQVLGVDGKREKFFRKALALVFESVDATNDAFVQFIIDGRPSEQHDLAFARAEGQRKIGIVGTLRDAEGSVERELSPEIIAQRADEIELATMRKLAEGHREQLAALNKQSATATEDQRLSLDEQVASVSARLDAAEAALQETPVRILEVHEHGPLLEEAMSDAESRLMIVSPWIKAAVVTREFVDRIRTLLERGVLVVIGYGIGDGRDSLPRDQDAEKQLQRLSAEHSNFHFKRLGDTHAKVLIADSRYAVVSSFNWLSFRGDPNRPFRDERGTYIAIESEINRLWNDYYGRMSSSADSDGTDSQAQSRAADGAV